MLRTLLATVAVLALPTAVGANPYTVSLDAPAELDRAFGLSLHQVKRFDADRVVVTGSGGGLQIRARSGGSHDANSLAYLVMNLPGPATLVPGTVAATVQECVASSVSGWFAIVGAGRGTRLEELLRVSPPTGCRSEGLSRPNGAADLNDFRFYLGAATASSNQSAGTSLTLRQWAATIDDPASPTLTATLGPRGAADPNGQISWSVSDAESGPHALTMSIDGGPPIDLPIGSSGVRDDSCLGGQWLPGCGTTASGVDEHQAPGGAREPLDRDHRRRRLGQQPAADAVCRAGPRAGTPRSRHHRRQRPQRGDLDRRSPAIRKRPRIPQVRVRAHQCGRHGGRPERLMRSRTPSDPTTSARPFASVRSPPTSPGARRPSATRRCRCCRSVPTNVQPPSISGTAAVGATLQADGGQWANGGQTGGPNLAIDWQSCSTAAGTGCATVAAGAGYTVPATQVGRYLRLFVAATNLGGSAGATSTTTAPVTPSSPLLTAPPLISGVPVLGTTLTATAASFDGRGETPTVAYAWERCVDGNCTPVSGATSRTITIADADLGLRLRLRATAANSAGTLTVFSDLTGTITRVPGSEPATPTDPANLPRVVGTAEVGRELRVDSPGSFGGSEPMTYSVTWLRCAAACEPVPGATGTTYTLADADIGARVAARVRASNDAGSASADSTPGEIVERRRGPLQIEARADALVVLAGRKVIVSGRITSAGGLPATIIVAIRPPGELATLTRQMTVPIAPDGAFSAAIRPRVGGDVILTTPETTALQPVQVSVGRIAVRPRFRVRFSVAADHFGRGRDLRVNGVLNPGVRLRGRLIWEAKTRDGRIVGAFCPVDVFPKIGRRGRFVATCAAHGLDRGNLYRVRYVPGAATPLVAAKSQWTRARLR